MSVKEQKITLGVLNAVYDNSNVSQRLVANEVGIALGLTNSYLKRCIKKGLIKVTQAPANRYAYYLTPHGFAEKTRLTSEFLSQGFKFFRHARDQCSDIFRICDNQRWRRVALHGLTDIAEIAVLCAASFDVEIVGIIDRSSSMEAYGDIPIVSDLSELANLDAVVITDLGDPQASYDRLTQNFAPEHVLVPPILGINVNSTVSADAI